MRRLGTALVVAAVVAVAVAALVDAVTGRDPAPRGSGAPASSPRLVTQAEQPPLPPRCGPGQLELAFEELGGGRGVSITHVRGPACRGTGLTLEVRVTDRRGHTSSLPLGEERFLDDEYTPGYGRLVPLSLCQEGAPFTIVATAGDYRATARSDGRAGINCRSARLATAVPFGAEPGADRFFVEALDPSTHVAIFRIELPHRADVDVSATTASGLSLLVLDRTRRRDCRRLGSHDVCVVQFGILPDEPAGTWTVIVRKHSTGPALVRVAASFDEIPGP
jgi:hypothetical protein